MVYSFRCAVAQDQSAARPQWNRALLSDVIRAALTLLLMLGCAVCPGATLELDRFVASFVLKAFGTTVGRSEWRHVYITERSESEIHGQSFRPLAYQYDRYGKNATRNVRVTFDWQNEAVFNTAQAHTWRMPLPPGTLDKLNYLLALMGDLVDGKRSMRYTIADGGRLKTYEMREAGSETLDTALGTLETLKMRRVRHADYGEATLWCAPALGFLPVKLENRDRDGRLVSMYIQSIEGLPPTVIRRPGG
jgi:hypothetical protein